ncbi:retrotransposon protein, putative, ty1-copia subclass [Tanacetum coccineum]
MTRKPFPHQTERATDLLGLIHIDVCGPLRHVSRQGPSYFITFTDDFRRYGYVTCLNINMKSLKHLRSLKNEDYALESATCILNMVPIKKVDKTPYKLWAVELEEIQDKDTSPSKNTREHLIKAESLEPQEDVVPIHRSVRTHQAPECLCLNVEVEGHSFGDFNEPTNYKATLSYPEYAKWLDA